MTPGKGRPLLGLSRLEMAFIVVLLALVGVLAVTRFLDLSLTARQSVDAGVVAAVRGGIADYASVSRDFGRVPVYPPLLDHANAGEATIRNRFFTAVVENGLAVSGWTKTGPNSYRAPDGEAYAYDPETGAFAFSKSETAPGTSAPAPTRLPASPQQ